MVPSGVVMVNQVSNAHHAKSKCCHCWPAKRASGNKEINLANFRITVLHNTRSSRQCYERWRSRTWVTYDLRTKSTLLFALTINWSLQQNNFFQFNIITFSSLRWQTHRMEINTSKMLCHVANKYCNRRRWILPSNGNCWPDSLRPVRLILIFLRRKRIPDRRYIAHGCQM